MLYGSGSSPTLSELVSLVQERNSKRQGCEEAESKGQEGQDLQGEKEPRRRVRLQLLSPLQLAELQCEVAALREEQKVLSGLVESLGTHIRALTEQQHQLRGQLEDLDSRLRGG